MALYMLANCVHVQACYSVQALIAYAVEYKYLEYLASGAPGAPGIESSRIPCLACIFFVLCIGRCL